MKNARMYMLAILLGLSWIAISNTKVNADIKESPQEIISKSYKPYSDTTFFNNKDYSFVIHNNGLPIEDETLSKKNGYELYAVYTANINGQNIESAYYSD